VTHSNEGFVFLNIQTVTVFLYFFLAAMTHSNVYMDSYNIYLDSCSFCINSHHFRVESYNFLYRPI
jgi:hypothetical protein